MSHGDRGPSPTETALSGRREANDGLLEQQGCAPIWSEGSLVRHFAGGGEWSRLRRGSTDMKAAVATVGIVGAGAAAQAIHLPTIAQLPDVARVTRVTDSDRGLAERVADGLGADVAETLDDLLTRGDGVDIAVICTPDALHAEQVAAACRAGVKVVLCEKPLATSAQEAESIAQTAQATEVPVVVGTMHSFDPAWQAALSAWRAVDADAHAVQLSTLIPPNPRTENFATEMHRPPARTTGAVPGSASLVNAVYGGVLGLAIHDLPLARRLLPDAPAQVLSVQGLAPSGYLIVIDVGGSLLELRGGSSRNWLPDWSLVGIGEHHVLRMDFGPSFVHAGSAVAELTSSHDQTGWTATRFGPSQVNGYLEQWRQIGRLIDGRDSSVPPVTELAADLEFAVHIADQCADRLRTQEEPAAGTR